MSTQSRKDPGPETVTVSKSDGWYVATDETTGIASKGKSKAEALENLAEAINLHERSTGDDHEIEPSDAPWF